MRTLLRLLGAALTGMAGVGCLGFAALVVFSHHLVGDRFHAPFYVVPAVVGVVGCLFAVASAWLAMRFLKGVPSTAR